MDGKLAFRPDEAAELISVRRDKLYELLRSGEVASFKLGRVRLVPKSSIEEFLERKLQEAAQ